MCYQHVSTALWPENQLSQVQDKWLNGLTGGLTHSLFYTYSSLLLFLNGCVFKRSVSDLFPARTNPCTLTTSESQSIWLKIITSYLLFKYQKYPASVHWPACSSLLFILCSLICHHTCHVHYWTDGSLARWSFIFHLQVRMCGLSECIRRLLFQHLKLSQKDLTPETYYSACF